MRYQNEELRRENENLRAQIYGPSASSSHNLLSAPLNISSDGRAYSLSPSVSHASLSGMSGQNSPPTSMGSDMMPMGALTLTSSMLPQSMLAYADQSGMSSQQPYSMVHPSGLHLNAQSSPESSGFRSSQRSTMGPVSSFQSLNVPQAAEIQQGLQIPGGRPRSSSTHSK